MMLLLTLIGVVGVRLLMATGLTRLEAGLIAVGAPLLVVIDAPLGQITPTMGLAANMAGCLLPVGVSISILLTRRVPAFEVVLLLGIGIIVAFFASQVVPTRGVLLSYRVPAFVLGLVGAALFHSRPERAGAAAFAAGALSVLIGADLMNLRELANVGGSTRVILGGAGLLDGIFLVALLAGTVAACLSMIVRLVLVKRVQTQRGLA